MTRETMIKREAKRKKHAHHSERKGRPKTAAEAQKEQEGPKKGGRRNPSTGTFLISQVV